jgi:O-antigen/teichoic acid export membrane protein
MASLGSNVVANLIGRAWPSLLGILFVPLYMRFMGIEAYGLVGFYATLQGVLGLLDLGIGSTMTRELARLSVVEDSNQKQRDLVRTLEILYWLIALAAGIMIVFLAPLIAQHWINAQQLSPEQLTTAIQLMGVAVALQFPFALYQGGLMGLQHQILVNAVNAVIGTLRAGGAVLVLWLVSPSITAFMGWQVVAGLVGSLTFMGLLWRNLPKHEKHPRFNWAILKELWRYAITVAANAMIGVAITQSDKIIVSALLPLTHFAYYSLAATIASTIWIIITSVNNAVFPKFVALHQNNNYPDAASLLQKTSLLMSMLLLPIAAILTLYSHDILFLWTNNINVANNAEFITILMVIGSAINGMSSVPAYAASAFGWPQLQLKVNLVQSFVVIPLLIYFVTKYGAVGGAFVWLFINSSFLFILTPLFFGKFLTSESADWAVYCVIAPLTAIVISSLTLRLIIGPIENNTIPIITMLFIAISVMHVSYTKLISSILRKYVYRGG